MVVPLFPMKLYEHHVKQYLYCNHWSDRFLFILINYPILLRWGSIKFELWFNDGCFVSKKDYVKKIFGTSTTSLS